MCTWRLLELQKVVTSCQISCMAEFVQSRGLQETAVDPIMHGFDSETGQHRRACTV